LNEEVDISYRGRWVYLKYIRSDRRSIRARLYRGSMEVTNEGLLRRAPSFLCLNFPVAGYNKDIQQIIWRGYHAKRTICEIEARG